MREKSVYSQLLALSLPLIGSSLLQQLYSTVDAMFVGQFVGSTALAATGTSSYIISILTYFFIGLSVGASIVTAQAYGASDEARVQDAVHTTVALSVASGLLLTIVGLLLSASFLRWMHVPDDVMPEAVVYLRLYFCGMLPLFLYNMGSGILRAIGDTRSTLFSLMISCGANIALDYLFIVVFKTGIAGAAWATVLSQMLAAVLILFRLLRGESIYRLHIRKIRFHRQQLKQIVAIGAPAGIQSVLQSFSNVYLQTKVNLFGSDVMAGVTAWGKIDGFAFLPIESLSLAVSSLVGQRIGARDFQAVKRVFRSGSILCVIVTVCVTALMVIFAPQLVASFTPSNPKALSYGVYTLRFVEPLYFIYGMNQIFSGVIRGTGESKVPMLVILSCTCGFRVLWISALGSDFRLLLYAYPLAWILTCVVFIVYYRKGDWLRRHIVSDSLGNYSTQKE